MPTFGALCFHSRQAIEDDNQLSNEFGARVLTEWHEPVGIDYVRTDADDLHIAVQYGALPRDVPIRVFLCYVAGECGTSDPIWHTWRAFSSTHGVKGNVSAATAAVVADLMRSLRDDMRGPFFTDQSSRSVGEPISSHRRLIQGLEPLPAAQTDDLMDQPISEGSSVTWRQVFGEAIQSGGPTHIIDSATSMQPTPQTSGNAAAGLEPTRENSFLNYRRNRERYGNFIGRRQQESAVRRVEQQQTSQWIIDWQQTNWWTCPGPNGEPVNWAHHLMEARHLWETICWLVNGHLHLFNQYHGEPGNKLRSLAAKQWLASQPAFRALVQEAVRRRMTFPNLVFQYLRDYVLPRTTTEIAVSPPWADPAASHQFEALAAILDIPLQEANPQVEFGREYRDIDIDTE